MFDIQQFPPLTKIIVFAGNSQALPTIQMLMQQKRLIGVVLPVKIDPISEQLRNWLIQSNCAYARSTVADNGLICEQLMSWQADLGIAFGFGDVMSESTLAAVRLGVYHFHAAAPDEYYGNMPLYWLLRNADTQTKLTLQRATYASKGAIALQQQLAVHPLDTLQSLENKIAQQGPGLINQFIDMLYQQRGDIELRALDKLGVRANAPQGAEVFVDWQCMDAAQISALSRAGNLLFGGCMVSLGQMPISLLQATVVNYPTFGVEAGTICHIGEPEGLIVATHNGAVRFDILSNNEGIYSGLNFVEQFDINVGNCFISVEQS